MECFLKMLVFCHHNNLGFFCLKLEGGRRWASCTISLDRFQSEVCRSDLYKSAYASVTGLVRPGEPVRLGMICREYRVPRASRTDALRSLQPGGKGCWALRKGPSQSIPSKGKAALSPFAAKGRKPSGSHMCLERPLHLEFFPKTTTAVLSQCDLQCVCCKIHRDWVTQVKKKIKTKEYIRHALSFGDGKREQQCAEDKRFGQTFTPLTSMQRLYLVLIYLLMCFLSTDTKPEQKLVHRLHLPVSTSFIQYYSFSHSWYLNYYDFIKAVISSFSHESTYLVIIINFA